MSYWGSRANNAIVKPQSQSPNPNPNWDWG